MGPSMLHLTKNEQLKIRYFFLLLIQ